MILILLAAAATVQAQTEKGQFVVGANDDLGFNVITRGDDTDTTTGFGLGTSAGYLLWTIWP